MQKAQLLNCKKKFDLWGSKNTLSINFHLFLQLYSIWPVTPT